MTFKHASASSHKKNVLEWSIFGLSLVLLAAVLAALAHQALTIGEEPARLSITLGTPVVGHGQVRIPLKVSNDGDSPAVAVAIEVTGMLDGAREASPLTFDYIPRHAHRAGWVSFPNEVIPSALSARVLGYADP